jgi:hypothetical protein
MINFSKVVSVLNNNLVKAQHKLRQMLLTSNLDQTDLDQMLQMLAHKASTHKDHLEVLEHRLLTQDPKASMLGLVIFSSINL